MERKSLPTGALIKGQYNNSTSYVIDKCIGYGASSIVYDAHYIDKVGAKHYVRLKECYPYNRKITRIDSGDLLWDSQELYNSDKEKFIESYKKTLELQGLDDLRNVSTFVVELIEANGTLYLVMNAHNAQTFDNDKRTHLSDILSAVKLLDYAIGKYHKNGYLHLDIKPSNFMVFDTPNEHIILFDNDSVILQQDLADNKIEYLPYSKEWAPLEQIRGQFNSIGPETDIYSIGATLFYKVMGHSPGFLDVYPFAEYVFKNEKFEKVNPKIKRLLRKIFKKTIVTVIDERYHSTDELFIDLKDAFDCVSKEPFLLSDYKYPLEGFVGRYEELGAINEALKNHKKIFISGIGGIGKSELVKKYAFLMQNTYDAIIYLRYTGNETVNNLLAQIDIYNCEINNEKEAINALQMICKELNVLFILDNFDISDEHYDQLNDFLGLSGDKLITTRTDFRDSIDENTTIINVGALGSNNLISLFEHNAQRAFTASEKQVIDDILKQFEYHTLMVPILARKFRDGGYRSIDEFKAEIDNGISKMKGKTVLTKDGITYRLKVYDLIERVFAMSALESNPDYISALSNLYFLRNIRLTRPLYKDIVQDYDQMDALNELIMLGWVQEVECENKEKEIQIHPLIIELIRNKINPKLTDREELCNYLKDYIVKIYDYPLNDNGELSNLEYLRFKGRVRQLINILSNVNFDIQEDLYFALKLINELVGDDIFLLLEIDTALGISKKLNIDSIGNVVDFELKFLIANWLEKISVASVIDFGTHKDEMDIVYLMDYVEENVKPIEDYFEICLTLLDGFSDQNKDLFIYQMCLPIILMGMTLGGYLDENVVAIVSEYSCVVTRIFDRRWKSKMYAAHDDLIFKALWFYKLKEMPTVEETSKNDLATLEQQMHKRDIARDLIETFSCYDGKFEFESTLDMHELLTTEDRISLYISVITPFNYLYDMNLSDEYISKSMAPIKWERFEQIKEILVQEYDYDLSAYKGKPSLEDCCAIANIMSGQSGGYEKLIYPQINAFNKYIEQLETPQNSYYIFDTLDTIDKRSRLFNNLFVLSRLQNDSLILGDLIKISDSIKTKFNLSSDEMFDWYRTIRDCAERALRGEPDNKVFASYYNTYRDLCTKLSNKI